MPAASAELPSPSPTSTVGCDGTANSVSEIVATPDRLACYGSTEITLPALLGVIGAVDCPGTHEPGWLYCSALVMSDPDDPAGLTDLSRAFFVALHPDAPQPPAAGGLVRVTGHFDDVAAQDCRFGVWPPALGPMPDPAETVLRCREMFVVTDVVSVN